MTILKKEATLQASPNTRRLHHHNPITCSLTSPSHLSGVKHNPRSNSTATCKQGYLGPHLDQQKEWHDHLPKPVAHIPGMADILERECSWAVKIQIGCSWFHHLLVFGIMQLKLLHIHIIHSIQHNLMPPEMTLCGKTNPLVSFGTTLPTFLCNNWLNSRTWDMHIISNKLTVYANPDNDIKFWTIGPDIPMVEVNSPWMLALHCVVFCATTQCTPWDLALYAQGLLGKGHLNATTYSLILDRCGMEVHPEARAGDNTKMSLLAFLIVSIIGSPALHWWAATQLAVTLGTPSTVKGQPPPHITL